MNTDPEELSSGQPKRLIWQPNHKLTNSLETFIARSGFVEKAGREWTGRFESAGALGGLELCPKYVMTIPGVGVATATAFTTAIEDPANFARSRSVGAWVGLTTRRFQSGEVDYDGHISRRGDANLRALLYEAASVILSRTHAESDLRTRGLRLREKLGFKRAAVAVARKLAIIMHPMLESGKKFN